ncbi:MAG: hypothetical protein DRR08_15240 [Candidatus Parabeggiatoa sp. nov. 2]|nr:MAG: hypothetical protein B6247_15960 [Beggiatoa sp. 4572_84]RKZ58903.1 MAG: hypothetical protein DRR08_15240 [Gammaproteobacteria bacterium]
MFLACYQTVSFVVRCFFYEFRRQLEYKSKYNGNYLLIADRWFPSSKICSKCGDKKQDLSLNERIFKCVYCGHEIDRDLN